LAACRAVICAALWPDPADENCPQAFRDAAAQVVNGFARTADGDMKLLATSSEESKRRWATLVKKPLDSHSSASLSILRSALLDFIADFANWDNSTVPAYLETARALTQAAHEAFGGELGTRPLVVDPFAGGGSIPLEALRVGADAFASDLNPIPVLLNKVIGEYIPKFGRRLADEVRKWGRSIRDQALKDLAEYYPCDPDGSIPIAYLWARTIKCEGVGCGLELPLLRSPWIMRKGPRSIAFQLGASKDRQSIEVTICLEATPEKVMPTVRRGSATCPACGYTTPARNVRDQFLNRNGGANDARLLAVVLAGTGGCRTVRGPIKEDLAAFERARAQCLARRADDFGCPHEPLPYLRSIFNIHLLGAHEWGDLFLPRQIVALTTFARLVSACARIT
jgi:adenine-specific DNA methylase